MHLSLQLPCKRDRRTPASHNSGVYCQGMQRKHCKVAHHHPSRVLGRPRDDSQIDRPHPFLHGPRRRTHSPIRYHPCHLPCPKYFHHSLHHRPPCHPCTPTPKTRSRPCCYSHQCPEKLLQVCPAIRTGL